MQQPQEFIVYRNPLEAQIYHMMMSGSFFVVLCGIFAFFVAFLAVNAILTRYLPWNKHKMASTIALIVGVIAGIVTVYLML